MENPLRGIALVLASTFVFSLSDATGKFLTGYLPVTEIAWIRYVIFVAFAFALVLRSGPGRFHVRRPWLQILRGLGLLASALFFIFSLRYLPLADASAIGFISPLLTSMLAIPILGEVVGLRRWMGGIAGLIGVLVVVRPGTARSIRRAAGASLLHRVGVFRRATRILVGVDSPTATLMWSAVTGAVLLTVLQPLDFAIPTVWQLALLLMLGIIASGGQYLTVLAYRHAPASVLAPFNYVQLVWATTLGYLVFSAVPDAWTLAGAGIIVASGLWTLQVRTRRTPARAHAGKCSFASVRACNASRVRPGAMSSTTKPRVGHVDHRQVGVDALDGAERGQRIGAAPHQLRRAVLRGVLHQHPQPLGAGREIHRAADRRRGVVLAGRPVGDVAVVRHLERAQHAQVQMPAADHREAVGMVAEDCRRRAA